MRNTDPFADGRSPTAAGRLHMARPPIALRPIWWLGNGLTWLGGASWRAVDNRHERSLYVVSGFFVLLNGVIATGLAALAAVGMQVAPDVATAARYTFVWGVFVATFDRAVSAKVVDPDVPRWRSGSGYVLRGVAAALIGFIIAEAGAMAIFHQDIDRTMQDTINAEVNASQNIVTGTPGHPTPLERQLTELRNRRTALDDAVTKDQQAYNTADQLATCEKDPSGCPTSLIKSKQITGVEGNGDKTRLRDRQRAAAQVALDQAQSDQKAQEPDLDQKITKIQGELNGSLQHAHDLAESSNGVPAKWRAMLDFTGGNATAELMHVMIILFCVLLDLIPLLLKLWRGRTGYEGSVLAARQWHEHEITAARENHQDDLRAAKDQRRLERQLDLDVTTMRTDATRTIETERERLRIEQAMRDLTAEPETPEVDDGEPVVMPQPAPPVPQPMPTWPEEPSWPDTADTSSPRLPRNWMPDDLVLLDHVFNGRYAALEPLQGADTGAFGRMLLARDEETGKRVVIKAVREPADGRRVRLGKTPTHKMWRQEVETARRLRHPNIGEIMASGTDLGYLWTVSPLYAPGSLVHWIDETTTASPDAYTLQLTFQNMSQLVSALEFAHGHKVTHGDIKPTNVVLHGPTLLLVDWGFARLSTLLEPDEPNLIGGTPLYTAPEALLDKDFDPELADMYSVGATWYFMLTGRPPYEASDLKSTPREIARRIRDGQVPCVRLDVLLPDLPRDVVEVVHSVLSPDPLSRLAGTSGRAPAEALRHDIDAAYVRATANRTVYLPVGRLAVRPAGHPGRPLPTTVVPPSRLAISDLPTTRLEPVANGSRHDQDTVRLPGSIVLRTVAVHDDPPPTALEERFDPGPRSTYVDPLPPTQPEGDAE